MRNTFLIAALLIWLVTVIVLLFLVFCPRASAGSTFQEVTHSTVFVKMKGDVDLKRIHATIMQAKIAEQKKKARKSAEDVLSAAELQKIKEQADSVLEEAKRLAQAIKDRHDLENSRDGAMVVCLSQVIK